MRGAWAQYNRLEEGKLTVWGEWNDLSDCGFTGDGAGSLFREVVERAEDETLVYRDLSRSQYAADHPALEKDGHGINSGRDSRLASVGVGRGKSAAKPAAASVGAVSMFDGVSPRRLVLPADVQPSLGGNNDRSFG